MLDEHPKCLAHFQTNRNKASHADSQALVLCVPVLCQDQEGVVAPQEAWG